MIFRRKIKKILNMKLAWLLILVAGLHYVSTECSDTSQTVNCQEVAKNHVSVPSNINKDISVLYLSCNHIILDKNDTAMLWQYNNLSELYLNNNSIVVVSNYSFVKLLKLKILDVSNNYIQTIEKAAFAGLNELQILNLQNNKITELNPDVFAGLKKLKVLNLENNFLKVFDVKGTVNLICIQLNGNVTSSCDHHWLNSSIVITENLNNTTCPIPITLEEYPNKDPNTLNYKQMGICGTNVSPFTTINITNGTTCNYTNGPAHSGIQPVGKSWTFLMGVLAVILSTTALIIAAIKFPTWYRYLKSYNHRRLQEKEESEMFEETFTPQLGIPPQASATNEEESIVVFEQFRPYIPEDEGFIEDKYIDP
ncbi:leucine-rich repeat-containing protein 19 [Erythrolamprus reginae]|uniref:leucine-rich repeat-containing protein 19 n=1 Tax=Erythrolamprus reginae TaxID=121349 RepID=UPI00396C9ABF